MVRSRPAVARGLGRAIGNVALQSSRHPRVTLLLVLGVTLLMVSGATRVSFEENLLHVLPRDQPDTVANLRMPEDFPSHHSYVAITLQTDPVKWEAWNAKLPHRVPPEQVQDAPYIGKHNATDEVYLRGLESFLGFLEARLPPDLRIYNAGWQTHIKLLNYTNSYNPVTGEFDEDSYRLPGTDPAGSLQFASNWRTVYLSAPAEVSTQASTDWDAVRTVYLFTARDGSDRNLDHDRIGRFMADSFQAYAEASKAGAVEWDVFDLEASGITDAKVVDDAHQKRLAEEELRVLGVIILLFVVATLLWAFRAWQSVVVSSGVLMLGLTWSFGFMGYAGIPLNAINLIVIPLIFGVGIDYSIHFINGFLANKAKGLTDDEAFREVGQLSGFAMLVATSTTVIGLGIMVLSPSLLLAQLGLVSAVGLVALYLITLTFIPAAFSLLGTDVAGARYRRSRLMPAIARVVARHRWPVLAIFVAVTVLLAAGARDVRYETFGNPALNFPEGDPVRDWYDRGQTAFYGEGGTGYEPNWVIIQGDHTRPEVHDYIARLQEALRESPEVRDDSVTSIRNVVIQWEALKQGTAAAGLNLLQERAQPGSTYPATQAEIRQSLDEIFDCHCMAVYASILLNRDYDMSVMVVDTRSGGDYAGASRVVDEIRRVVESLEDERPDGVEVNLGGYTVFSYLFIKHQMPWVETMSVATTVLVGLVVFALTRDWRATLLLTLLMAATSLWWIGILPHLGIGLSIMLTIPLVFIYCIGSDYGLHLMWDLHGSRDLEETFGVTGKAVLFSALTDLGAFALLIPMSNLMVRKSMLATAVAILVMLAVTLILVPALLGRPRSTAPPLGEPLVPEGAVDAAR